VPYNITVLGIASAVTKTRSKAHHMIFFKGKYRFRRMILSKTSQSYLQLAMIYLGAGMEWEGVSPWPYVLEQ